MATGRLPDPNTAPVTAKGDLYTYSTVPAKLAVGNNGETLVADSSTATGLRYQGNYAAGKNKLINGDFSINQRGFTSTTTSSTFMFDRWTTLISGDGTATFTSQTFTPGTSFTNGYEADKYLRIVTASQTSTAVRAAFRQRVENINLLAGQTITVSFWAKASSGTPKVGLGLQQVYGTGGSPSTTAYATPATPITIGTTWTRYSFTITVPSLSGKTLGTDANTSNLAIVLAVSVGSDFTSELGAVGIQNNTFEFWGIQAEIGSVATAFQTATGTLAGELAACQRYYWRFSSTASITYTWFATGISKTATTAGIWLTNPVPMRTGATSIDFANLMITDLVNYNLAVTAATLSNQNVQGTELLITNATGATALRPAVLRADNSSAAYIGCSAEL